MTQKTKKTAESLRGLGFPEIADSILELDMTSKQLDSILESCVIISIKKQEKGGGVK